MLVESSNFFLCKIHIILSYFNTVIPNSTTASNKRRKTELSQRAHILRSSRSARPFYNISSPFLSATQEKKQEARKKSRLKKKSRPAAERRGIRGRGGRGKKRKAPQTIKPKGPCLPGKLKRARARRRK